MSGFSIQVVSNTILVVDSCCEGAFFKGPITAKRKLFTEIDLPPVDKEKTGRWRLMMRSRSAQLVVVVVVGAMLLMHQQALAGDWFVSPGVSGGWPHLIVYQHDDSDYSHLSNESPPQAHPRNVPFSVVLHNPSGISISYSINNQKSHTLKSGDSVKWIILGSNENPASFNISFNSGGRKVNKHLDNFAMYDFQGQTNNIDLAKHHNHPPSIGSIKVRFTNRSNNTVVFFLNGGAGLWTQLNPGQSSEYTMATYQGLTPAVEIVQPKGGGAVRRFSVDNGGRYAFNYNKNGIDNFFDR